MTPHPVLFRQKQYEFGDNDFQNFKIIDQSKTDQMWKR